MRLGVWCDACDLRNTCATGSILCPAAITTVRGLTLTHGCLVSAARLEVLAAPILLAIRPSLDPIVMSHRAVVCGGGDFTPAVAALTVDVAAPGFLLLRPIGLPITETICAIEGIDRADWARHGRWLWLRHHTTESCGSATVGLPGWTPTALPGLPASDAIDAPWPEQVEREKQQRKTNGRTNAASIIPAAREIGKITTVPDIPVGLLCAV